MTSSSNWIAKTVDNYPRPEYNRHCEEHRDEAIQKAALERLWIAAFPLVARNDDKV